MLEIEVKPPVLTESQQQLFQEFADRIAKAMAPFHPGDIYMSIRPAADFDRLVLEVQAIREYPCEISFERIAPTNQYIAYGEIVRIFRAHFNGIYVQPDDHIQLGLE